MFAPSKCAVLSSRPLPTPLVLHGSALPLETSFRYLGHYFTISGFDLAATISHRLNKAQQSLHLFAPYVPYFGGVLRV